MRKVFIAALAFVGIGSLSPTWTKPITVEALCNAAAERCVKSCDYHEDACQQTCNETYRFCLAHNAQIQIRGFSKGSAGGSLKDLPGGTSGATPAGPNSHAVGVTTTGMSANPGAATATPHAAISSTIGGAGTNSDIISINGNGGSGNNGGAATNSGVISAHRAGAGGGSSLLSRPGMPKLRAQ